MLHQGLCLLCSHLPGRLQALHNHSLYQHSHHCLSHGGVQFEFNLRVFLVGTLRFWEPIECLVLNLIPVTTLLGTLLSILLSILVISLSFLQCLLIILLNSSHHGY